MLLLAISTCPVTAATIRVQFLDALHDGPAVGVQALGVGLPSTLIRHVLPVLARPLTLTAGGILLTQVALDALLSSPGSGFASWGSAFGSALPDVADWWLPLSAGLALYLTCLALGLIARGLASWRIAPLSHGAHHASGVPPSVDWPLSVDTLSAGHASRSVPQAEQPG